MDKNERKIFELEQEKKLREALDSERKKSDDNYAIKLAEKVVFAIVGLVGVTVAGTLIKVALDYLSMTITLK